MQALRPLDKPPVRYKLAAFDTEGDGIKGPICGAFAFGNRVEYYPGSLVLDRMAERGIRRSYRVYAHNLTYDLGVLLPYLPSESVLYLISGDVYRARLPYAKDKPLRLFDSARLFAFLSLDQLGKSIGVEKLPTPPELMNDPPETPEWYCKDHNRLWCVECYVKQDALVLLKSLELFQDTIIGLGGQVKNTLAASAMDLFRRRFQDREYYTPFPDRNDFARNAYYGGRVEPFVLGTVDGVNVYDVVSLYPSVMFKYEFPNPNTLRGPTTRFPPGVIEDYEGVSEVVIEVPPSMIPPLPFRREGKLYFPYGKLEGFWTHAELRYAMEQGAKLLEVRRSLFAKGTCRPFRRYVKTLFDVRSDLKELGDPREKVVKILLNALYGKFGQRQDAGLEKLMTYDDWEEAGMPKGSIPVFYGDTVMFRAPVVFQDQADFCNTLWAAYITSYARMDLHRIMSSCPGRVFYCDTDSIFTDAPLSTSSELGGLQLEHHEARLTLYGAKLYRIENGEGEIVTRAKGVPSRVQGAFLEDGRVSYEKPLGFLEANARHATPSEWVVMEKMIRSKPDKRKYDPTPAGGSGLRNSAPLPVSAVG